VAEFWQRYANLVDGLASNARERATSMARALLIQAGLEAAMKKAAETAAASG
jgi:hypothetical protein